MLRFKGWLCAGLIATVAWGEGPTGKLMLTTEESPPFNMLVDGKVVGIAADKVSEMFSRAKLPYALSIFPWARAYQLALHTPNTCVFATARTAERASKFKWVGPLAVNPWVLYALSDRHIHLNTLDEARAFKIGTYNADVRDNYLRAHGFNVDAALSDAVNARKLLAGRIDLWATGPFKANTLLKAEGLGSQIVPVLIFNRSELYLACNPTVSTDIITRLNDILTSMASDGTAMAIDRRYAHWPR